MTDETQEAVSPNGNLTGLSAQLNRLPVWAMNAILVVMALASVVQMMPEGLPPAVVVVSQKVLALGVLLGIASPGVRK